MQNDQFSQTSHSYNSLKFLLKKIYDAHSKKAELPHELCQLKSEDTDQKVCIDERKINNSTDDWMGEIRAYPTLDSQGQVKAVVEHVCNVTDHAQAETIIQKCENQFRSIFDNTGDAIFILDPHKYFIEVNEVACQRLGYTRDEFLKMTPTDIDIPEQAILIAENTRAIEQNGQAVFESVNRRKDGTNFPVEVNGRLIKYNGQTCILAIVRDITDRKKAEKELLDSEQRYRSLFEASMDAILLTSPDGEIHDANPAACALFGMTKEEICTLGRKGLVDTHDSRLPQLLEERKLSGRFQGELRQRRKDGTLFDSDTSSILFVDSAGNTNGWTIIRDISERKKLEAQFLQAQKMESIGRLAGGVAHDFNNMLSVILGFCELAMFKVESNNTLYCDLKEIHTAARRSTEITRQLLAFARKQTISPRVLDLNEIVKGMLKMLRRLIGENINLVWMPSRELWQVRMDPAQIDQILANLCVNARDAIAGVGEIIIKTENVILDHTYCSAHDGFISGSYILLCVSDNGCGMDKETLRNIFEPFFTTKIVGQGTGLGLATVYGIVRQNNGHINVYSDPEKGTVFNIYLPRQIGECENSDSIEFEEVLPGNGETLLIVEDEPSILSMTMTMLKKYGYHVLTADRPSEAVQIAKSFSGQIHLLITDVIMPEMNGTELGSQLIALHPDIKILFMSGYPANVIADNGILDKKMHFIKKPFSINKLAAKVREAIDKKYIEFNN